MGLFGATSVGVGAIVGGGILALAGVAFATTGASAMIAFALNGVIALLTALSFAEMSSRFPESGGTYTFSRKVLSIEAAFTVGWVVWFASVVAAVLYALGFAHFFLVMSREIWLVLDREIPWWMSDSRSIPTVALVTTCTLSAVLMLTATGEGKWLNLAKVMVFALLILAGFWAVSKQPVSDTQRALVPFFLGRYLGAFSSDGIQLHCSTGFRPDCRRGRQGP